jgi:hypothetical protein
MLHSKLKPLSALEGAAIHPLGCRCTDCAIADNPVAWRRARRVVRLQAVVLLAALVGFYALVAFNAGNIAAAFGLGQ